MIAVFHSTSLHSCGTDTILHKIKTMRQVRTKSELSQLNIRNVWMFFFPVSSDLQSFSYPSFALLPRSHFHLSSFVVFGLSGRDRTLCLCDCESTRTNMWQRRENIHNQNRCAVENFKTKSALNENIKLF